MAVAPFDRTPRTSLGTRVLCVDGFARPSALIEPVLDELPIAGMAPGSEHAAVLVLHGVVEPELHHEPPSSAATRLS